MSSRLVASGPIESRGLALLLGWGGGAERHVQKHATVWHRAGWRTLALQMTFDMTFLPAAWTALPGAVDGLLAEARAHRRRNPDSLLVAHAFSNAGLFAMTSLLRASDTADAGKLTLDGAVYDSAPSPLVGMGPWAAPFVIGAGGGSSSKMVKLLARHLPYAIAATAAMPVLGVPPPLGLFGDVHDPSRNEPRPELFIYGPGDALISAEGIEAFADARLALPGGAAQARCRLDGSGHVAHFKTHPAEYSAAVEAFAQALAAERPASGVGGLDGPAALRARL